MLQEAKNHDWLCYSQAPNSCPLYASMYDTYESHLFAIDGDTRAFWCVQLYRWIYQPHALWRGLGWPDFQVASKFFFAEGFQFQPATVCRLCEFGVLCSRLSWLSQNIKLTSYWVRRIVFFFSFQDGESITLFCQHNNISQGLDGNI